MGPRRPAGVPSIWRTDRLRGNECVVDAALRKKIQRGVFVYQFCLLFFFPFFFFSLFFFSSLLLSSSFFSLSFLSFFVRLFECIYLITTTGLLGCQQCATISAAIGSALSYIRRPSLFIFFAFAVVNMYTDIEVPMLPLTNIFADPYTTWKRILFPAFSEET